MLRERQWCRRMPRRLRCTGRGRVRGRLPNVRWERIGGGVMGRWEKLWLRVRPLWAFDMKEGYLDTGISWRGRRNLARFYRGLGRRRWLAWQIGHLVGEA